jgi:hypothetical protein
MALKLPIEIDRRQKVVAGLMLCGFDLPQEVLDTTAHWLAACEVCPDIKMDEIPARAARNRRLVLLRARTLIDEMIEEEEKAATPAT